MRWSRVPRHPGSKRSSGGIAHAPRAHRGRWGEHRPLIRAPDRAAGRADLEHGAQWGCRKRAPSSRARAGSAEARPAWRGGWRVWWAGGAPP